MDEEKRQDGKVEGADWNELKNVLLAPSESAHLVVKWCKRHES